jgi:hypothetical protein
MLGVNMKIIKIVEEVLEAILKAIENFLEFSFKNVLVQF